MNTKSTNIVAGLFVVVFATAFVWGVLWFSAGGPRARYRPYEVYMTESVSGVRKDTAVTYLGVEVGRVKEVSVDPDNLRQVRLLLEVEESVPIKADTMATLKTRGLTGLAFVDLSGGSEASEPLAALPGAPYPVIQSEPSVLGRLDAQLSKLIKGLIETSKRMNALFDAENREALAKTLKETARLMTALNQQSSALNGTLKDLAVTAQNTRKASARLPEVVDQVSQSVKAMEDVAGRFAEAGDQLKQLIKTGGQDVQQFTTGTLPEVDAMVRDLRQTAEHLKRASASLERDPSQLFYGGPQPKPGPGE